MVDEVQTPVLFLRSDAGRELQSSVRVHNRERSAAPFGLDSFGDTRSVVHQDESAGTHDAVGVIRVVQNVAVGGVGAVDAPRLVQDLGRGSVRPGVVSIAGLTGVHPLVGARGLVAVGNHIARSDEGVVRVVGGLVARSARKALQFGLTGQFQFSGGNSVEVDFDSMDLAVGHSDGFLRPALRRGEKVGSGVVHAQLGVDLPGSGIHFYNVGGIVGGIDVLVVVGSVSVPLSEDDGDFVCTGTVVDADVCALRVLFDIRVGKPFVDSFNGPRGRRICRNARIDEGSLSFIEGVRETHLIGASIINHAARSLFENRDVCVHTPSAF